MTPDFHTSFRDGPTDQTRNLEIPGSRWRVPRMTREYCDACGRLCAAVGRRTCRRLRVRPVGLRDRADGARHLALCAAAVDCSAAGPDLLGHLAVLDAACDVAEF